MADYYDSRSYSRPHHDSYSYSNSSSSYSRARDTDPYSRHAHYYTSPTVPASKLTDMRNSVTPPSPSTSTRYAAPSSYSHTSHPAHPSHAPYASYYRPEPRRYQKWPPSPSAEDEVSSLAKEVESAGSVLSDDGNGVQRGSVDQYPVIEEIESLDRRFVLVTDPSASASADQGGSSTASATGTGTDTTARDRRRKSFAERGGLHHLKTDINDISDTNDPPVFTERVSTPYAYTKPQKEKLAPSSSDYFLSPEPITPSASSVPRSVPTRDTWSDRSDQRNQNANPAPQPTTTLPIHNRYDSVTQSPRTQQNDVFDDSDLEPEDTTHLRTERKPARYSFVKSDLQKEHLRTDLGSQSRPQSTRRSSGSRHRTSRNTLDRESSGSSKSSSQEQSPRSSSSSLNDASRRPRHAPSDTAYTTRPVSPKLPPRRPASPNASRPPSRSGPPSASPLAYSTTLPPPSPGRVPVTEADWHSTFPAAAPVNDRSRAQSRFIRQETIPGPAPKIGVQSPSPARPAKVDNPLPYPVDDRPGNVFMPPEEQYQYDHSTNSPVAAASPRQLYPESPRVSSSSIPPSPRDRSSAFRPNMGTRQTAPEDLPRMARTRSSSLRSQSSIEGRRERPSGPKTITPLSPGKPLPSCPRGEPSSRHDDWYTLENTQGFDVCPSCYEGVFRDTPFNVYFAQTRRYERPVERVCDFSSPWVRLAWLLTIRQRRPSLDLMYALANIQATDRPCPGDRELSADRADWYGIAGSRDGVHVANFAICSCDVRMVEALFPSVRGYFTRIPANTHSGMMSEKYLCSLRLCSRRFPKYLDLLVEIDGEAQLSGQRPDMARFIQLARDNAFKGECNRGKSLFRKPWYYIPGLPELTVCEECYDDLIWPAMQSQTVPSTIPRLFNKAIQMVPGEDPDTGSSCCLYSPRMRRIFDTSVKEEDLTYLKRKAIDRKRAEIRFNRERKGIVSWMADLDRGSREWERAKSELRAAENEWASFE